LLLLLLLLLAVQVQAANDYARRSGFSPKAVHFVVGDALAPPLPAASFDLVLSLESACYMPDKG
jgi:ubiquinone/menaquinone biosynthesis C-methylase UbiE